MASTILKFMLFMDELEVSSKTIITTTLFISSLLAACISR